MYKKSAARAMGKEHREAVVSHDESLQTWLDILLENASDGVFILTAEDHRKEPVILDVNRSIAHWTGIHKDRMAGQELGTFLKRPTAASPADWSGPATIQDYSEQQIPVDVTLQQIPGDENILVAFVRRDENLQPTLARALEEKAAAENMCQDFFARINHDLRTPLNGIIGFSEIMQKGIFGEIEHDQYRGYASDIHAAGLDLKQKIDELLEINSLMIGASQSDFFSLIPMVNNIAGEYRVTAEEKSIRIRTDFADILSDISGDRQNIARLIAIVSENAVYAAPPESHILFKITEQNSGIVLTIEDQGLPPDHPVTDIFTMSSLDSEDHLRAPDRTLASEDLLRALCQRTGCLLTTSVGTDGGHVAAITIPRKPNAKI